MAVIVITKLNMRIATLQKPVTSITTEETRTFGLILFKIAYWYEQALLWRLSSGNEWHEVGKRRSNLSRPTF